MELTGNTFFFQWEVALEAWLQANLGSAGTKLLSFFSAFGEEIVLILLLGVLYWWYDKEVGKRVGLTALAGMVWNAEIKNIFIRRRPYMDHKEISLLRKITPEADEMDIAAQGFSFPSGHSTNAVTVYGSLGLALNKKWMTVLAVALPLLVGFSRVVVGAHYPTDVLVGWLLGVLAMAAVDFLSRKMKNEAVLFGIILATALPGLLYCRSEDYFTAMGLMIGFMAGHLFEVRKVHFENTRNVLFGILRVLGGFAIYFLLNKLLKMPFSAEFLDSGTTGALLVRLARYAVIAFVEFGIYPMAFAPVEGLLSRKGGGKK